VQRIDFISSRDLLKYLLNSSSDMIMQELIKGTTDQWSKRLLLVIRSHGAHTEHHFAINYVASCLLQIIFVSGFCLEIVQVFIFQSRTVI